MENQHKYRPINEWNEQERPREKLLLRGISALTDAEIIALLIGSGTRNMSAVDLGRLLLDTFGGLSGIGNADIRTMVRTKGIGQAKAITLSAAFEIAKRKQLLDQQRFKVSDSKTVAAYLAPRLAGRDREMFYVLYLNNSLKIIDEEDLFRGGITSTTVDVRIILKRALTCLATSIIISHNHPSGSLEPSKADIDMTAKIKKAAAAIDVELLDHLIITQNGYFSFADKGMV